MIDPAMLRPGRLDKLLYVPLPDGAGRAAILRTLTRRTPLGGDVDVGAVAADGRAERFSGADLGALVREAALCVLREAEAGGGGGGGGEGGGGEDLRVAARHFDDALNRVFPSVSAKDDAGVRKERTSSRQLRGGRRGLAPPVGAPRGGGRWGGAPSTTAGGLGRRSRRPRAGSSRGRPEKRTDAWRVAAPFETKKKKKKKEKKKKTKKKKKVKKKTKKKRKNET
eukprot:TRINITY_DN11630_c0_g1_i1.p2 TRINITY_DN11630_c0_g1~~TRINITY_DN11630_c0_g1_i1.p2  ORF type:complete len:225 (-),score=81.46 TRINITY_DN11630_c0_g1_i1:48-722(-)